MRNPNPTTVKDASKPMVPILVSPSLHNAARCPARTGTIRSGSGTKKGDPVLKILRPDS